MITAAEDIDINEWGPDPLDDVPAPVLVFAPADGFTPAQRVAISIGVVALRNGVAPARVLDILGAAE